MTQKQRIIGAALAGLTVQTPEQNARGGDLEPNDWLDSHQTDGPWAHGPWADYWADTWVPAVVTVVAVAVMAVVAVVECYLLFS